MARKRTIESIRKQRAFERSWKGCLFSWAIVAVALPLYVVAFGLVVVALRWDLRQGGWIAVIGSAATAAAIFIWLMSCGPLGFMLRRRRRAQRRTTRSV